MSETAQQPAEHSEQPPKRQSRGQPTKYRKAYCEQMVAYCQEGASLTAFAGEIGVCRDTLTNWGNDHPEFFAALKRAKAAAATWYDKQMRESLANGKVSGGSAALNIFALKNFAPDDFKDVQERHHTGGIDHYVVALPGKSQDADKWIEANRPDVPVLPDLRDDDGEE